MTEDKKIRLRLKGFSKTSFIDVDVLTQFESVRPWEYEVSLSKKDFEEYLQAVKTVTKYQIMFAEQIDS